MKNHTAQIEELDDEDVTVEAIDEEDITTEVPAFTWDRAVAVMEGSL